MYVRKNYHVVQCMYDAPRLVARNAVEITNIYFRADSFSHIFSGFFLRDRLVPFAFGLCRPTAAAKRLKDLVKLAER